MRIFLAIPGFVGSATSKPFAGQIECDSFRQEVVSPRDAATGQASGKRRHSPIEFSKAWEKSSPLLGQALVSNTAIPKATFSFAQEATGVLVTTLIIELSDVRIASVEQAGSQGGTTFPQDNITCTFRTIKMTFMPPGLPARIVTDTI